MTIRVSERAGRIIRSQMDSGRFGSEEEVVEEALRRLGDDPAAIVPDPVVVADQDLQRRLYDAGLVSEIKPPITDMSPWEGRQTIRVDGEPVSETILRERR